MSDQPDQPDKPKPPASKALRRVTLGIATLSARQKQNERTLEELTRIVEELERQKAEKE